MKRLEISFCAAFAFAAITFTSCDKVSTGKVELKTDVDTLSYISGINEAKRTQIVESLKEANMADYVDDFLKGLEEGFNTHTDDYKTLARMNGVQYGYALRNQIMPSFSAFMFDGDTSKKINPELYKAGLIAEILKTEIPAELNDSTLRAIIGRVNAEARQKEQANAINRIEENKKFFEENAGKEGIISLPSGLQYKVLTEGNGAKPTAEDIVRVYYKGTKTDGSIFEETEQGKPAEFPLNRVIRGWTEGIQLMPVGSKYIFYIPSDLAYGERGSAPAIAPNETLVFEVELVDIVK